MRTATEIIKGLLEHAGNTEWVDSTNRCGDWIQQCDWCGNERYKGHREDCDLVHLVEDARAFLIDESP